MKNVKLIAFDLDGTLTQHKEPLTEENRCVLEALAQRYQLLMVGAGQTRRIFRQLGEFPIDIIGNYGLQYAEYNKETGDIDIVAEHVLPCDRESVTERVEGIRKKHGFTEYYGDTVEFHASGAVTIPIIGTKAPID